MTPDANHAALEWSVCLVCFLLQYKLLTILGHRFYPPLSRIKQDLARSGPQKLPVECHELDTMRIFVTLISYFAVVFYFPMAALSCIS